MNQSASPLNKTLTKINAYSEHFKLHLGVPAESGWRLASDIVANEAGFVAHLARLREQQPYLPKHVVATNFYDHYEWHLVTAGTAAFLLDQRVPDLDAGNIAWKFDDEGWMSGIALAGGAFACLPGDDAAGAPGVAVLHDREALRRHLVSQVWAHVRQLMPLVQAYVPTSEQALRLATANSLAGSALWMLQAIRQGDIAEHESRAMAAALPFPTQPRYFAVECNNERELYLDGSVCCHWYARPDNTAGAYCANCPKVPIAKRIETLRGLMLARRKGENDA